MKELKKYSQALNLVQGIAGTLAVTAAAVKPDLITALSPGTASTIIVVLAVLNAVLTKIKQGL